MSAITHLRERLARARAHRRDTRAERAMRRNESNALRLANQRGENNKGGFSAGGGG
jgi:hypothetical protein